MTVNKLTCRELVELVTEYLEATLPPSERARFEAHLATCPECRNHVAQMRYAIQITGTLSEESFPVDTQNELLALFRGWKKQALSPCQC